jgi:hypothetical protein
MAINRGYKPAEQVIMDDWYNPSMEMLAQVGAMAQKQQDDLGATLSKYGAIQFNALQKDYEKQRSAYKDVYENINKLSQGAMGDGDLRSVRAEIERYGRELSRRTSSYGDIGSMEANYKQYTDWAKTVDEKAAKEYGKDGITSAHAQALKDYVLSQYQGIGEQDEKKGYNRISLANPANAVDITEITEKLGGGKGYIADSYKDAEIDPATGEVKGGAMWRDQGRIWRKTGTTIEEVKAEDVFRDLMFGISKHEGYGQYLNQLKQLGLSEYGMGDMYVDKVDEKTGETKRVLNENHPIVQEAKRGASKFGFKQIEYSDDIKFDEWDLEEQRHQNKLREERLKGQMMTFQSTSIERDLDPAEIEAAGATMRQDKTKFDTENAQIQTQLRTGKNSDGTELSATQKAALQSRSNELIKQSKQLEYQIQANQSNLNKLAEVGGFNIDKEFEAFKKSLPANLKNSYTKESFVGLLQGKNVPTFGDYDGASAASLKIMSQQIMYKGSQARGAKIGITQTNDVILATDESMLGKKMKEIENAIATGQVNFVSADGTYSFNQKKFSELIATGKAKVVPLATSVNGQPGFQVTIVNEKGKEIRTITGTIPGVENNTWFNDLAVDFRDRAQSEGISTAKGQALNRQADMYDGIQVSASDMYGVSTGQGSFKSQIDLLNLPYLKPLETSPDVYLNNGLKLNLTSDGNGNYVPSFYRQKATSKVYTQAEKEEALRKYNASAYFVPDGESVKTEYKLPYPTEIMTSSVSTYEPIRPADLGLPTQGAMSIEDIYSYVGKFNKSERQGKIQVQK